MSLHSKWLRRGGVIAAVLIAFLIGISMSGGDKPTTEHAVTTPNGATATAWTCAMHPQVQLPESGPCPICGMDLVPVESSVDDDHDPTALTLSPGAMELAQVRTSPVTRREVETTVRMVGILQGDETRTREISAWVAGRIDRMYIDYTGVAVAAGDKLFDLYSPELYSAQEELIQAVDAAIQLSRSDIESTRLSAQRTVQAARERLRLWGLTETQIAELESRKEPRENVTIVAPAAGVVLHKAKVEGSYVEEGTHVYSIADLTQLWLKLDAYESELALIATGQNVEFTTETYPGDVFTGTVSFIDPFLTERSRSVKVRVDVPNPDARLKPGMFARASLRIPVPADDGGAPLVIPVSAPLLTGTRAVVYVADPETPGRFQGREITLGPRAGDFYVVREGLTEGDRVVSNGNFKIDSALQIQAKRSMMSPRNEATSKPGRAFLQDMDAMLLAYYDVADALAGDDLAAAREAAAAYPRVATDGLDADGVAAWQTHGKRVASAVAALESAVDIETARNEFLTLSKAMIAAVERFQASGAVPALVFHCPMADHSRGADWLQPGTDTRNPYYGSSMLKCGARSRTLVSGDAGSPHQDHR